MDARLGTVATSEALGSAPALLHIAAHAVVDWRDPAKSALLLADGPFRSAAVSALDLRGAIVVLTACRGASGEEVEGEGPLGLARSFLAAGAGVVIANRWKMTDRDAVAFSDAFYEALAGGHSLSEAKQAAATSLREAGRPARAWAGMVLYGDGRRAVPSGIAPRSRFSGLPTSALGLGLALLVGGGLARMSLTWRRQSSV